MSTHRTTTSKINPKVVCKCGTLTYVLDEKSKPVCYECMVRRMKRKGLLK